jgi:uncharacterized membrane protein (DUF441 family)
MRRETLLWALVFSLPTGLAAGSGVYILANAPVMGVLFGAFIATAIFALVAIGGADADDDSTTE